MIRSGLFLFVLLFYLAHPLGAQKFWLTTYEFPGGPKTGISGVGDTCLIAGLTNGVLRSFDEGRNWDTVLTSLSIFSVHATPQGIVLAGGRGEIYYSNDMGTTWDSIQFSNLFPFVEFAHNDRGELFAISGELDLFNGFVGDGVYFSSDNGHSWTPRNQGLDPYLSCMQIAIDRNGRLYVAVNDESISGKGGLFISEDKGMSWQHVDILVDGKGVIENFVEVEHATGLSISPDDSVHISVFGATGNVLIRLNLSKSIHDLHKTDFWKVTPAYNSSLWWTDKILFDIHFAANGDRYSSAQGSLIWGGSFFRKNGTTDWIRTIQGLGFDAFGEFSRQQFYEKSSGKVFMVQYLDERIYWADTSRVVGSYSPDRQLGIALYPNPVSAGGHLYLNFEDYNGPCQYILEDLNGRLWSQGRIDRSSTGLDVPNTPGCYRLSLQNARGDKTSRLILVLFR